MSDSSEPSEPIPVPPGAVETTPAPDGDGRNTVTPGMRIASDWAWRYLAVVAALAITVYAVTYVSEVSIPIAVALLLCALLNPVKRFLIAKGWKRTLATITVFIAGLLLVVGLLTLVVRQFISGAPDLVKRVGGGLDKIRDWLVNGPLSLSESQVDSGVTSIKNFFTNNKDTLTSGAISGATTAGHVIAGLAIALFTLFFFLRDGEKIWAWLLRLAPKPARRRIDGAADQAWTTLGGYVRATVLVALVDAIGIGVVILIVGVPLAIPLAALVFLASFIPVIGATLSGAVAVLVALVANGPVPALIVLAGVIAVQQLEGHVLQPLLLGRAVHVHPLAVVLSIAAGVILAGITGALLAVPIAACLNAAIRYIARDAADPAESDRRDRVERRLEEDEAKRDAGRQKISP